MSNSFSDATAATCSFCEKPAASIGEGLEDAVQEVGSWFGTPIGASIKDYASNVRNIVAAHARADAVARAAQEFCAEICEDSPGVPQPQLKALHIALDKWEVFALRPDAGSEERPDAK